MKSGSLHPGPLLTRILFLHVLGVLWPWTPHFYHQPTEPLLCWVSMLPSTNGQVPCGGNAWCRLTSFHFLSMWDPHPPHLSWSPKPCTAVPCCWHHLVSQSLVFTSGGSRRHELHYQEGISCSLHGTVFSSGLFSVHTHIIPFVSFCDAVYKRIFISRRNFRRQNNAAPLTERLWWQLSLVNLSCSFYFPKHLLFVGLQDTAVERGYGHRQHVPSYLILLTRSLKAQT